MLEFSRILSKIVIGFVLLTMLNPMAFAGDSVRFYTEEPTPPGVIARAFEWAFEKHPVTLIHKDNELLISGADPSRKKYISSQLIRWAGVGVSNFENIDWSKNINVTELINLNFLEYDIGNPRSTNGVNCHGTSLHVSGLIPNLSYVGIDEFNFYMDNHCKQIQMPLSDSIGVLARRTILGHSYKVIGPNIIFQKKSMSKKDPFKFYLINDYGESLFFKCKDLPEEFCEGKYSSLKSKVKAVDELHSLILKDGQNFRVRDRAVLEVPPLLAVVNRALEQERSEVCRQDLLRMKYRLMSLTELKDAFKGVGLFSEKTGLPMIEPKY